MPDVSATSGKEFRPGQVSMSPGSTPYLGSEAVRSQGSGPFDPAYRQNLATYGGSQMFRPSGLLAYNPTDPTTFPGSPSGFGNAPVQGAATGLLDMALSGQPFMFNQSQMDSGGSSTQGTPNATNADNSWQNWLTMFNDQGNLLRPQTL